MQFVEKVWESNIVDKNYYIWGNGERPASLHRWYQLINDVEYVTDPQWLQTHHFCLSIAAMSHLVVTRRHLGE